jgi:hypothetical protein
MVFGTNQELPPDVKQKNRKSLKLSLQQKNWVLAFHIGFATLWTGAVLSMFLIAPHGYDPTCFPRLAEQQPSVFEPGRYPEEAFQIV